MLNGKFYNQTDKKKEKSSLDSLQSLHAIDLIVFGVIIGVCCLCSNENKK